MEGGDFLTAGGITANHIARWNLATSTGESLLSYHISFFPNPSKDFITITLPIKSLIEIYDIEGQLLKKINDIKETTIDISDLSCGVFIIKVRTGKKIVTLKFIKK